MEFENFASVTAPSASFSPVIEELIMESEVMELFMTVAATSASPARSA